MARTANPNWPQGYSIPYGIILSKNLGGELLLLKELPGHQLGCGEHLFLCVLLSLLLLFFFPPFLSYQAVFISTHEFHLFPIPLGGSEGMAVWCSAAC